MNSQCSARQGWNSELRLKNILLKSRNPMLAIALQYCSPAVALRPRWLLPRLLQGQRWYVPAWGWWFSKFCSACLFLSFSTAVANQTELLSWYIGWWASDGKLDDHRWCLMWFVSCKSGFGLIKSIENWAVNALAIFHRWASIEFSPWAHMSLSCQAWISWLSAPSLRSHCTSSALFCLKDWSNISGIMEVLRSWPTVKQSVAYWYKYLSNQPMEKGQL